MSFASLRRHALAPVLTAVVLIAPVTVAAESAGAAPTAVSVKAAAPDQSASVVKAKKAKQAKKLKKAKRTARKMDRLERRASRSHRARAHLMVERKHDWSHRQWRCLRSLWNRESGWRVRAAGAGGSYGIPQATPGHKMGKGWRTSAKTQIRWGLNYIEGRYKTPCAANRHSHRTGWY